MSDVKTGADSETARRARQLREAVARNQVEFARLLGIPFNRWNNFERGLPVSRPIFDALRQAIPGFSADWLMYGETRGLGPELRHRLNGRTEDKKTG